MHFKEKAQILGDAIGEGGQGKVFRVIPRSVGHSIDMELIEDIHEISHKHLLTDVQIGNHLTRFKKNIFELIARENPSHQKALKMIGWPVPPAYPSQGSLAQTGTIEN